MGLNGEKQSFDIEHTKEGVAQLEKLIKTDTKIGLESTGNYSKAIFAYLKSKGYSINYVDTHRMYNFARFHFPKIKNDKIDAELIANYMKNDYKVINPIGYNQLKDLNLLYYKTLRQSTRYKFMFTGQINIIFPELEKKFFLKRGKAVANMLLKYPRPQDILAATDEEIHMALIENIKSGFRGSINSARKIRALAQDSIGVKDYPVDCFRYTIKTMLFYQDMVESIKKEMTEALLRTPYHKLLLEWGYNEKSLAAIAGEVGDVRRFPSAKKFVAYCGLGVSQKQSGQSFSRNCYITKRGNVILRSMFYNMTMVHLAYKTEMSKFFYRLRDTGKHPKKCLLALTRKMAVKVYYDLMSCHN
jgi:transposase